MGPTETSAQHLENFQLGFHSITFTTARKVQVNHGRKVRPTKGVNFGDMRSNCCHVAFNTIRARGMIWAFIANILI